MDDKVAPSTKLPRSARKYIRKRAKVNPLLAKAENAISPGLSKKHAQFKRKVYRTTYKIGRQLGKSLPKSE